jgi:hypothetical protein
MAARDRERERSVKAVNDLEVGRHFGPDEW